MDLLPVVGGLLFYAVFVTVFWLRDSWVNVDKRRELRDQLDEVTRERDAAWKRLDDLEEGVIKLFKMEISGNDSAEDDDENSVG